MFNLSKTLLNLSHNYKKIFVHSNYKHSNKLVDENCLKKHKLILLGASIVRSSYMSYMHGAVIHVIHAWCGHHTCHTCMVVIIHDDHV